MSTPQPPKAGHEGCPSETSASKASGEACCAIPSRTPSGAPEGQGEVGKARSTWAALGLGVLASACCWLPLALAGAGVATGTLGARIAWIRPWALWGLALLLVAMMGWWAWKRFSATKAIGDCCAVVPKFPSLPVGVLIVSFAMAWAAPRLLHSGSHSGASASAPAMPVGGTFMAFSTPQFDCAPCAGTLPQTMGATRGVASVEMDFSARQTKVAFQPGADPDAILAAWSRDLGFSGQVLERHPIPSSSQMASER